MKYRILLAAALVAAALPVAAAQVAGADAGSTPTLAGRAVLPADTLAPGPSSGNFVNPQGVVHGILIPRPSQPVEGFSSIVAGRSAGEYLAMPDNGWGGKANSVDFLIRAYYIGFPIVNDATPDRLLTGGDMDPESLQRGANGDLWVGDEFGPWVMHFDATGVLLDPPYLNPLGVMSPNNPFLTGPATHRNSRGFEGMAISPDGRYLYPAFEGATNADLAAQPNRRWIFQFDTITKTFTGNRWSYQTEAPTLDAPGERSVADMWSLDNNRMVLIERDAGSGATAKYRTVYVVDRRHLDRDGNLKKTAVVDLTAISDPHRISLPAIHDGDIGIGMTFSVVCESIEAIYPLPDSQLLLGCDNNLPNTGRNPTIADDNEFIVVNVPGLLNS